MHAYLHNYLLQLKAQRFANVPQVTFGIRNQAVPWHVYFRAPKVAATINWNETYSTGQPISPVWVGVTLKNVFFSEFAVQQHPLFLQEHLPFEHPLFYSWAAYKHLSRQTFLAAPECLPQAECDLMFMLMTFPQRVLPETMLHRYASQKEPVYAGSANVHLYGKYILEQIENGA